MRAAGYVAVRVLRRVDCRLPNHWRDVIESSNMNTKPRKFRVRRTVWDAICAYEGKRRIETFGDEFDAKEWIAARRAEGHTVDAEGVY